MNLRKNLQRYINLYNYVEAYKTNDFSENYTELEYIESDGTQCIDTGIKDVTDSEFELVAQQTQLLSGFPTLLGALDSDATKYRVVFAYGSSGKFYTQCGTGLNGYVTSVTQDTNKHRFYVKNTSNGQILTIDNTTLSGVYSIVDDTDLSLYLCARNKGNNPVNYTSQKVYSLKIWKSGTLVLSFIPAKRNSDGVIGMYDKVSSTFFTNAGTGEFIAGPELSDDSLVLQDAIKDSLKSLKAYGKTELKPDTLLDTVVANGGTEILSHDYMDSITAKGGCEQRNLPAEYTQVNYVTNAAQTMINTGVKFDFSKNYEIELKASGVTGSWYILQARENTSAPISGVSGSMTGNEIGLNFNGAYVAASQISRVVGHIYYIKGTINNGNMTLYVKDETADTEETVTGTYTPITDQSVDTGLFGNTGGNYVAIDSKIYFARIKEDDNYIMDYVPCRQGTTVGFYDKVSGTFKTTTGLSAGTDIVPTPDNPVDIYCNNGVLKARHQSGLPLGYTLLEYIESTGTQYIDTGVKFEYDEKIETKINSLTNITSTMNVYGTRVGGVDRAYLMIHQGKFNFAYGSDYPVGDNITLNTDYTLEITTDNSYKCNLCINDVIAVTRTVSGITSTYNYWLFTGNLSGSSQYPSSIRMYYWRKTNSNGTLVRNFIPAKRNSDNVVGMYDLVSGQFFTNAGTGTFTAGNPVNDIEIYTDGTVETISVHSKNLFDKNAASIVAPGVLRSDFIRVVPGVVYSMSSRGNVSVIIEYNSEKTYLRTLYIGANTYTPNADTVYAKFNIMDTYLDTFQVERGSTATDYEPYFNSGTATVEMLLKVGNYQDEQEILSGTVTRKVDIKVLDGTENWIKANGYNDIFYTDACTNAYYGDTTSERIAIPCTHLQGTDATNINMQDNQIKLTAQGSALTTPLVYIKSSISNNDLVTWKNWLATQYANGTPVIFVYPLKSATTETVAKQISNKEPGVTEVIAGSLEDLEVTNISSTHTTPLPDYPLDINCNNGVLKYGFNYYSYNVTRQLSVENYPVELDRSISYSEGVLTCGITGSVSSNRGLYPTWNMSFIAGHKYACIAMAKGDSRINLGLTSIIPSGSVTGGSSSDGFYKLTSNYAWYAKLWECNTNSSTRLNIRVAGTDVGQYASFRDILVIDLTAIFGAGNEPTTSSDIIQRTVKIYTDGTQEVIADYTKNLFDENYPDVRDVIKYLNLYLGPGIYTCSYSMPHNTNGTSLVYFLNGQVTSGANNKSNQVDVDNPRTVNSSTGYVTIAYRNGTGISMPGALPTDYNCMIEKGSPATEYIPYRKPLTANCELLNGIDTYTDTHDVISGAITRNIGIKVLDGTESWSVATTDVLQADVFPVDSVQPAVGGYCTALSYTNSGTLSGMPENSFRLGSQVYPRRLYVKSSVYAADVTTWTTYLADQYAAGTPVIVVYPLATATTETVSKQILHKSPVSITEASMTGLTVDTTESVHTIPSPDFPLDLYCNNGKLSLLDGYTRLDYIQSSGTQWIDTGITNENCDTYAVRTKYSYTSLTANSLCGNFEELTGKASFGQIYINGGSTSTSAVYSGIGNRNKCTVSGITTNTDYIDEFSIDCVNGTMTRRFNGSIYFDNGLDFTTRSTTSCALFGCFRTNITGATQRGSEKIYYFQIYKDGKLVIDLIPAKRNSDNVIGMYDLVSGQFFTNQGTGTFTAGNSVVSPISIGTPEELTITGKNLLDVNNLQILQNKAISDTGVFIDNPNTNVCDTYVSVKPNTTYTISGNTLSSTGSTGATIYFRLAYYDSNKTFISRSVSRSEGIEGKYHTFITDSDTNYIKFHYANSTADLNTYVLEEGTRPTQYENYMNINCSVEDLLSVGNYQDIEDLKAGITNRKVAIKVLDGTEGWTQSAATNNLFYATISNSSTDNTYIPVSSHFQGVVGSTGYAAMTNGQFKHGSNTNSWYFKNTDCATAAEFSQFLAAQYASGTPVIVIYPLATETTESTITQSVDIVSGTNTIGRNSEYFDSLGTEVNYKKLR